MSQRFIDKQCRVVVSQTLALCARGVAVTFEPDMRMDEYNVTVVVGQSHTHISAQSFEDMVDRLFSYLVDQVASLEPAK